MNPGAGSKMKENTLDVNMILAGDVGGTKTLLGVFDSGQPRPSPLQVREYRTPEYPDLSAIISLFIDENSIGAGQVRSAAFGVAGPVLGTRAELTNVPF